MWSFAQILGPNGSSVDAVAPGPVNTAMWAQFAEDSGPDAAANRARWAAQLPMGRFAEPDEPRGAARGAQRPWWRPAAYQQDQSEHLAKDQVQQPQRHGGDHPGALAGADHRWLVSGRRGVLEPDTLVDDFPHACDEVVAGRAELAPSTMMSGLSLLVRERDRFPR
jgi:hypothetical protein